MLGTTSISMRTPRGYMSIRRRATKPLTRGETGKQSLGDETLNWLDQKLAEIDNKLKSMELASHQAFTREVEADLPQIAAQAKEVIEAAIASGKLLRGTDLENKPQAKDQNELGN